MACCIARFDVHSGARACSLGLPRTDPFVHISLSAAPPLPCRGGVGGGVSVVLTANGDTDPTPSPSP